MDAYSTDDVAKADRVDYWRDLICDVFVQLDCETERRSDFAGRIVNRWVGAVQLTDVWSTRQDVARSPRQIAKTSDDYFLISIQTGGNGLVRQHGREARLNPGDFALYDSTEPYELLFDGPFSQLVLQMRQPVLNDRLSNAAALTALKVDGGQGIGKVVSTFLRDLANRSGEIEHSDAPRIADNASDLIATALMSAAGSTTVPTETTLLASAKSFMNERLADPDLTAGMVAAAHGISTRHLSRLFEASGESPSRWLWSRRFDRCRDALGDPAQHHRPLTDIAFAWGFNDLSHFSRGFRARYGLSPRDYRRARRSSKH